VRRRGGFTFVEMLTVLIIMGILSALALLKYMDFRRTAMTSQISGAISIIRVAAYAYEADHQYQWPAESGPGVVPPELVPYLPVGFEMTKPEYELDWDNFSGGAGNYQIGVTVRTADPVLMAKIVQVLGGASPYFYAGDTFTYMLIDATGNW
jgi:prepilin-type N-terminal cleavage/methylation domain-containing protein